MTPKERLLAKTRVLDNECWEWTGFTYRSGYGQFWFEGRDVVAHRVAYELLKGPIPDGLQVDHTCHNADLDCPGGWECPHRRCCNPDHLEAVAKKVNILRGKGFGAVNAAKTHCPQGHPYDEENTYRNPDGSRGCVQCRSDRYGPLKGNAESRKTECPQGHPYDEDNTRYTPEGFRYCRECARVKASEYYWRKKNAARASSTPE